MSNTNKGNNPKEVSALDRALELFLLICRKTRHYLGLFFIDLCMRSAVSWYDRRHPRSSQRKQQSDDRRVRELTAQIDSLNSQIAAKRQQMAAVQEQNGRLTGQADQLRQELGRATEECRRHEALVSQLQAEAKSLKEQNEHLLCRCLPESDIPSMIYYAEGDALGATLRKISPVRSAQHIYRLITRPGDTATADFVPEIPQNASEVIANRSVTLIACEILSIAPNASSVVVSAPGKAVLENGKWKVTNKAKIHLT